MKLRIYLVGLVLFGLIAISSGKPEEDEDEGEEDEEDRPRSCQKYLYDFVTSILKNTLKCLGGQSTFKLNSIFELATRPGCLLKCVLQQDGVIGMDGRLDDIQSAFYFEETFDTAVKEITLPEAQACFAMADGFNPKEYWCKTYLPFVECAFKAILKGVIPYAGDCVTTPVIGILFSVFKYLTPDSPTLSAELNELRRSLHNATKYKCLDKNCTRMYEYKKVNGSNSIVLYNKDMEVISVEPKKPKPQLLLPQQQPQLYTESRSGNGSIPNANEYNQNQYPYKSYQYKPFQYNNNNNYNQYQYSGNKYTPKYNYGQ